MLVVVGTFTSQSLRTGARCHHMTHPKDLMRCTKTTQSAVGKSYFINSVEDHDAVTAGIKDLIKHAIDNHCPVSLHIPVDLQCADLRVAPVPLDTPSLLPVIRRVDTPSNMLEVALVEAFVLAFLEALQESKSTPLLVVGNQLINHGILDDWLNIATAIDADVMPGGKLIGILNDKDPNYCAPCDISLLPHSPIIQCGIEINDVTNDPLFLTKVPDIQLTLSQCRVDKIGFSAHIQNLKYLTGRLIDKLNVSEVTELRDSSKTAVHMEDSDKSDEYEGSEESSERSAQPPLSLASLRSTMKMWCGTHDTIVADVGSSVGDLLDSPSLSGRPKCYLQEFYASIGWSLPATLGVMLGQKALKEVSNKRIFCFIGDGAFLMTATELVTLHKYATQLNKCVIVCLLDNSGYLMEKIIHDGGYNDLPSIRYEGVAMFARCPYVDLNGHRPWENYLASYKTEGVTLVHIKLAQHDFVDRAKSIAFGQNIAAAHGIPRSELRSST
eukprot:Blabericola_migrator_1__10810@NODE_620_length_7247_cov_108_180641_g22_i1_p1_GENE_NODE_620_length_7247_cov_108_180641_g22_i1NODE_620_length_7247_cov_108_180641_g22_i1_p1_ORF_typecomplete_len498_score76_56TPP_enzyme_C/PF02775_21/8_5e18TPP_enzyme_M/PF00205_22/0_11_NODE_620_length_7247_cov_108_180641_g22_i111092602